jgi:hypothetical protein
MTSQYLTFEVNSTCNLAALHPRCPINDPERYRFGRTDAVLTDEAILGFWQWMCAGGFAGIVLWHLYNEPTLALDRTERLMTAMQAERPDQRFHLWTNHRAASRLAGFNHIQVTDYALVRPGDLDNRRASVCGDGRPYRDLRRSQRVGVCGRGAGWEVIIDHHGNWLLCCNDWRAEESVGNIFVDDWSTLRDHYQTRARIAWRDEASYNALPRLCRACLDVNPNLHKTARVPVMGAA